MSKNHVLLLMLAIVPTILVAQLRPESDQMATIQTMVDGYNSQNFQLMKKPWGFLGKVLITKKRLRETYGPHFKKYGKVEIDTVVCSSIYTCKALLSFENDPYKRGYWQFIFNNNSKLQGFGNAYPMLIYPKKELSDSRRNIPSQKTALIDSIIREKHRQQYPHDFNGCVLAMEGDDIVYRNCFGNTYSNPSNLNEHSRFLLASCSKQFTAMAIMILVENGNLDIKDSIRKFFPELPYNDITIEHLLTHTSGLPEYMPLLKKYWNKDSIATNKDVIELLVSKKPKLRFTPNTKFDYSNTGYVLLASIIEKVSGSRYGEFLHKNIFNPLEMNETVVVARRLADTLLPNYAYGHIYDRKTKKYTLPDSLSQYDYVIYQDGIVGDDGISSSLTDLSIWIKALKTNQLISKNGMETVWTPYTLENGDQINYGYGFFIEKGDGVQDLIYHTGGWPGYTTVIMQFVEIDKTVIVLSNNNYNRFLNLADEIAGVLLYR